MFGKSKREGRALFEKWAERNNARFTGLVIPNVFGPFGNPYYNSVVATFCHQLTHNEQPKIEVDATLKMIYIGDLVSIIWNEISHPVSSIQHPVSRINVPHSIEKNVTELLAIISRFKEDYFVNGQFPALHDTFERDLFNTFRCYIDIEKINPVKLKMNTDDRGTFVETIKTELGGQVSFSTTKPGITRGNHFHTRKIERFAVIKGKARIQLRRIGTDKVMDFYLDGNEPSYVDMPIWYTHNITNVGNEDVYTIFWINEFFNPNDPDTYFETV
jgi:UDP-2-acetamido-2,6-beta-L-arabino-hexul-4-ose reductase